MLRRSRRRIASSIVERSDLRGGSRDQPRFMLLLVTAWRNMLVVHICTPNNHHARLSEAALTAGKHVICEKPLVPGYEHARELASHAAQAGLVTAVPYVYRYYPMVLEARNLTQTGELGRVFLIHGSYLQDWLLDPSGTNWRVDATRGGASRAFADIGSHWCDLAEFISGDQIAELSSQTQVTISTRPDPEGSGPTFEAAATDRHGLERDVTNEDIAAVLFKTERGALGSMLVSQVSAGHKNHLEIHIAGTEASLFFDQQEPDQLRVGRLEATTILEREASLLSSSAARHVRLPAGHPQGYQDCFDAFVGEVYAAIRSRPATKSFPTFDDGARAALITEAVIQSARAGGEWVSIKELV